MQDYGGDPDRSLDVQDIVSIVWTTFAKYLALLNVIFPINMTLVHKVWRLGGKPNRPPSQIKVPPKKKNLDLGLTLKSHGSSWVPRMIPLIHPAKKFTWWTARARTLGSPTSSRRRYKSSLTFRWIVVRYHGVSMRCPKFRNYDVYAKVPSIREVLEVKGKEPFWNLIRDHYSITGT